MINTEKLGFIGIVMGVAAISYSCFVHYQIRKTNSIINISIEDVSKGINVDVSANIIDMAVETAVQREVSKAVRNIAYTVKENVSRDIKANVKTSVDESYSNIRNEVTKEVANTIANLDMKLLTDQVKKEAKQIVLTKFNDNLDSLLKDFNQNLTNVSKIYGSIADNMVRKPQETFFKMSN